MKKLFALFLAGLMLFSLLPVLAESADFLEGIEPKKMVDAAYEAAEGLPFGTKQLSFEAGATKKSYAYFQCTTIPAKGQYVYSIWYKTNVDSAATRLVYVGSGKDKPFGNKEITITLPGTEGRWKQFQMTFATSEVVEAGGTNYVATKAGEATEGVYKGLYFYGQPVTTLGNGEYVYFTAPSVVPQEGDVTGKYLDVKEIACKDNYGSGEALYNVLGVVDDKGTQKTAKLEEDLKIEVSEDGQVLVPDTYAPVPLPADKIKPALSENLLKNPGFEELDAKGVPADWRAKDGWGIYANADKNYAHSGTYSARISTDSGGKPHINQVAPVQPLTTYQLTLWVKQTGFKLDSRDIMVKFEFNGSEETLDETYLRMDQTSEDMVPAEGGWMQFEQTITTPVGARSVKIYPRIYATPGTVWLDDISFVQVSDIPGGELVADQVFYYDEVERGTARFGINRVSYLDFDTKSATVDFALKLGDAVVREVKGTPFCDDYATFRFLMADMAEYKTEYTVEAKLILNGAVAETLTTDVYKYKRPSALDKDGNYYDENGNLFTPVIAYHWKTIDELPILKEGGINTIQLGYSYAASFAENPEKTIEVLDALAAQDMKAVICLYQSMKPAAHADNEADSRLMINTLKDHKAVFAWAIMDEPNSQIPNVEYYMKKSSKLVRDLDDKHPIYICDTINGYELRNALFADVYLGSTYPGEDTRCGMDTYEEVVSQVQAVEYLNKPQYHILSTTWEKKGYAPNAHTLRNTIYMAYMAGARGYGYYKLHNARGSEKLYNTELWDGIVAWANSEESALAEDIMVKGKYPLFSQHIEETFQYKAILKDSDVYMVILNGTNKDRAVSAPLVSDNGQATLAGGNIEVLYGAEPGDVTVDGDKITASLGAYGVAVLKITNSDTTAETLALPRYQDLAGYDWAAASIDALDKDRLLEAFPGTAYRPDEAITRADFAMLLVETLNFEFNPGELPYTPQFADVDESAYYAKALQIGRRIGILKGVDAENFSPDATITRQDMMTICARGLLARYMLDTGKSADLMTFTDGGSIADYARGSVSMMAGGGYILGNADGTINPLGNTTRAEAAVLMARILKEMPKCK